MLLFNRYQRTINIDLPYNYIGTVGRATYGYDGKYLAEVNFGYNGSEQFAPGHKMGFFPSFSAGWVPTKEDFVRDALPWLSFAKLRASYGQVRSEEHTSELQSLMRISYAVFCLKKKTISV